MILGFGDSHVYFSLCRLRSAGIFWLGPITMHRFGRDDANVISPYESQIGLRDTILFMFGEIDIRCHLQKESERSGLAISTLIERLVREYLHAVLRVRSKYRLNRFVVSCVMPPAAAGATENPDFPFIGSVAERVAWTNEINTLLRSQCTRYGISFWDFSDLVSDHNGALDVALSDGTVHIHPRFTDPILNRLSDFDDHIALNDFDTSMMGPKVILPERRWYDKMYNQVASFIDQKKSD